MPNPKTEPETPVSNPRDGIIAQSASSAELAAHVDEREKRIGSPYSHNKSLAACGAPFTILQATEVLMDASDLDQARGIPKGTKIPKIVYTVLAQSDWTHKGVNEPDKVYKKGEYFKLVLTANDIRRDDMERITGLITKYGKVENCSLQTYKSKRKGFSDPHGIVSAEQWQAEPK